jgi:hypothetical protein
MKERTMDAPIARERIAEQIRAQEARLLTAYRQAAAAEKVIGDANAVIAGLRFALDRDGNGAT